MKPLLFIYTLLKFFLHWTSELEVVKNSLEKLQYKMA